MRSFVQKNVSSYFGSQVKVLRKCESVSVRKCVCVCVLGVGMSLLPIK